MKIWRVVIIFVSLCASLASVGEIATNTFLEGCCRAIDQAAASGSWRWSYSGALEKNDAVFQDEIRQVLVVNFPSEYGEALSCAGNTHNPKMRRLHDVLPNAIRQTQTWRRIAAHSVEQGYGHYYLSEGLEKLMLLKNPDGERTFWSFIWARGRKADVTLALRATLGKFRARSGTADMADYCYDDGFRTDGLAFQMRGCYEDESGPFRFCCSYGMAHEPECARQKKTRELGRVRTFAEFDGEPSWRLLARRPGTYTSENVLKALGKPTRSVRLRCKNCSGTDALWEYEIGDADDCGKAVRHTLVFSFSADGRCRGWKWIAE